jgi:hypothetical protein
MCCNGSVVYLAVLNLLLGLSLLFLDLQCGSPWHHDLNNCSVCPFLQHCRKGRRVGGVLRLSPADPRRGSVFCAPPTAGPTSETQEPAHPLQQQLAYARASSPAARSRWLPPLRGTGEIKVCSRPHSRRCECWVAHWGSFCFPLGCWAPFGSADNPSSAAGSALPSPARSDRPVQDRLVCCLFCASYWR